MVAYICNPIPGHGEDTGRLWELTGHPDSLCATTSDLGIYFRIHGRQKTVELVFSSYLYLGGFQGLNLGHQALVARAFTH